MSQQVRLALHFSPPSRDTILFLCPVKVTLEHQIKERKNRQVVLFRPRHQICAYMELIKGLTFSLFTGMLGILRIRNLALMTYTKMYTPAAKSLKHLPTFESCALKEISF